MKTLLVAVACGGIGLMVATSASADFVGVVSEIMTDPDTVDLCEEDLGLTVCNVSIQFDEDDDRLLSVAFADVQVLGAPGAQFNQVFFGGDTPYNCTFLPTFPDLICDSYVTIGEKCYGEDSTTLDTDWNMDPDDPHNQTDWFNDAGQIFGGWLNNNPLSNGLGDAVNYPDGRVLILQSSVAVGLSLEGSATLIWQNIGDPTVFEEVVEIICEAQCPNDCPADVNGDGETGPSDLASLLAQWGPTFPDNCLDANDDGLIGAFDLAILLASWGPCP